MPIYEYAHKGEKGPECTDNFLLEQSIKDDRLEKCPLCGHPVERLIFPVGIATPKTNTELKNLGFTKLVKRDDGVYENVTQGDGEKRYMQRGDASSLPNLTNKISD
ncbi:zinc ribbon domain-containing protein [bacterium]|nr:zinc ribbon domain-containing protein [bacterium]